MNLPAYPDFAAEPAPAPVPVPRGLTHRRAAAGHPRKPHSALPDGRPLLLTMSRKCLFVQLTQSLVPSTPEEGMLLLYLCSPEFDPEQVWQAPEPSDKEGEEDLARTQPNVYTAIRQAADVWADETLDPDDMLALWDLARMLWHGKNATATVVIKDAAAAAGEKKSPEESSLTGRSNTSASSPEETPPNETTSCTISISGTPMPASTPGAASRESPSSPPPSEPADSNPPASA